MSRSVDRAVILAAGLGTRLKWLTHGKPKALMSLGGDPAIVHVIRRLASQGIRDIAINVHHHAEQLMDVLGCGEHLGVRLYFSPEKTLLDSGGGVRTALQRLPGDGLFVVHNADVIADIDVQKLAALCPADGCALALVPNPGHHPRGDFALADSYIESQGEPRYTYAGVSVWDVCAISGLPAEKSFSLLEPIRALISEKRCRGRLHHGKWFDIGRPRDLFRAARDGTL